MDLWALCLKHSRIGYVIWRSVVSKKAYPCLNLQLLLSSFEPPKFGTGCLDFVTFLYYFILDDILRSTTLHSVCIISHFCPSLSSCLFLPLSRSHSLRLRCP